jgi:hypothetical protein
LGVAEGIKVLANSSVANFIVRFIWTIAFVTNALAAFIRGKKNSKFSYGVVGMAIPSPLVTVIANAIFEQYNSRVL